VADVFDAPLAEFTAQRPASPGSLTSKTNRR
jgi:hypothetical protein